MIVLLVMVVVLGLFWFLVCVFVLVVCFWQADRVLSPGLLVTSTRGQCRRAKGVLNLSKHAKQRAMARIGRWRHAKRAQASGL